MTREAWSIVAGCGLVIVGAILLQCEIIRVGFAVLIVGTLFVCAGPIAVNLGRKDG